MTEELITKIKKEKKAYIPELNQIEIIGTIVKPPSLNYSESTGKPCFTCRIVWRKKIPNSKGQWVEKVGYINCKMWNSYSEKAAERFKQKDLVLVQGYLDFIEIQNNDNKLEIYNIIINNIQLISRVVEKKESE